MKAGKLEKGRRDGGGGVKGLIETKTDDVRFGAARVPAGKERRRRHRHGAVDPRCGAAGMERFCRTRDAF